MQLAQLLFCCTGGHRLVQFLGFGKNCAMRKWVLHSQFPLVQILLRINSTSMNFIPIALKFVLVEIVLVETLLVGDSCTIKEIDGKDPLLF